MTKTRKPIRITRADKQDSHFAMARATAQDTTLSFEARGMLAYLLSKPDDWEVRPKDLQQLCGRDKVYRILKELIAARYIKQTELRDEKHIIRGYEYYVYELPFPEKPKTEEPIKPDPLPEKPYTDLPYTENTDTTYKRVLQNQELTDSKVVSVDTTLQPSPISDLEKPIEESIEIPEGKSEPEKAAEPITSPSEESIPEDPPSSEPPPVPIQQRYIALIHAWHNAIPENVRPIGDPPIDRNIRVGKQLHGAGITEQDIADFVTDKHPGYSRWCIDKGLPSVMPFEYVQRYIRSWLNQRDGKAVKFKTSQEEADEFLENWCEDCNRPLMYCNCGQEVIEKQEDRDSVAAKCWNMATMALMTILPKSARHRVKDIKPVQQRGDAVVIEVHNPVFRDELELTLRSVQFTEILERHSGGKLTRFQVVTT